MNNALLNVPAYVVVGRDANGNTVYYTGKAGQGFVSNQLCDAFAYSSVDRARRRATMLNVGADTHGIRFFVPVGEQASNIFWGRE